MVKCFNNRKGLAHDGDTLRFSPSIDGFKFVRLPNIDTPEKGQKGFNQAKVDLNKIVKNKKLTICPRAIDRTRLVADVFAGNIDVTRAMKKRGW